MFIINFKKCHFNLQYLLFEFERKNCSLIKYIHSLKLFKNDIKFLKNLVTFAFSTKKFQNLFQNVRVLLKFERN